MKHLILSLLLCVCLCGCPVQVTPDPAPIPPVTNMRDMVTDVVPYSVPELVPFFTAFADVIQRDTEIIGSTGEIREAYIRAGRLAFQKTGLQTQTAGLGEKVDSALERVLGLQDRALTDELRRDAVAIFHALAWAVE